MSLKCSFYFFEQCIYNDTQLESWIWALKVSNLQIGPLNSANAPGCVPPSLLSSKHEFFIIELISSGDINLLSNLINPGQVLVYFRAVLKDEYKWVAIRLVGQIMLSRYKWCQQPLNSILAFFSKLVWLKIIHMDWKKMLSMATLINIA